MSGDSNKLPSPEPILRFFECSHLPVALQAVSQPFADMAKHIMTLPRSAERTVALRKLLESKDAAVRAALPEKENA
jgi:hypothetical protein